MNPAFSVIEHSRWKGKPPYASRRPRETAKSLLRHLLFVFTLVASMIPCRTYRTALEFLPKACRLARSAECGILYVSRRTYTDPRSIVHANDLVSPRHQTLTLLHKVSKFLPIVPKRPGASEPTPSLEHAISQLHQDLSTTSERPVKIVGACNAGMLTSKWPTIRNLFSLWIRSMV